MRRAVSLSMAETPDFVERELAEDKQWKRSVRELMEFVLSVPTTDHHWILCQSVLGEPHWGDIAKFVHMKYCYDTERPQVLIAPRIEARFNGGDEDEDARYDAAFGINSTKLMLRGMQDAEEPKLVPRTEKLAFFHISISSFPEDEIYEVLDVVPEHMSIVFFAHEWPEEARLPGKGSWNYWDLKGSSQLILEKDGERGFTGDS